MAENVIAEAIAGIAVEGVSRSILQAVKTVIKFESFLENNRRTVQSLRRNINRITQLNESDELQDQMRMLVLLLEQAEELINRCSRISWWNYLKKYRYSKKLIELDASLRGANVDLLLLIWASILQIQDEIIKLNQRLEIILQERNDDGGILSRSRTKVIHVAGGLKKIVQSIPIWSYHYLSWLLGIHRRVCGYRRITLTSRFCPNHVKGE